MPAKKRIKKEDIIDGAMKTLREGGYQSVNARSVAKAIGCSTQPIYIEFENMEELKDEMVKKIMEIQQRIFDESLIPNKQMSRYCSYGLGVAKLARDEKYLFRYLYLDDVKSGLRAIEEIESTIVTVIMDEYGYSEEVAKKFHKDMSFAAFGIAAMNNTGLVTMTDEEIIEALAVQFKAMTTVHGFPPKGSVTGYLEDN